MTQKLNPLGKIFEASCLITGALIVAAVLAWAVPTTLEIGAVHYASALIGGVASVVALYCTEGEKDDAASTALLSALVSLGGTLLSTQFFPLGGLQVIALLVTAMFAVRAVHACAKSAHIQDGSHHRWTYALASLPVLGPIVAAAILLRQRKQ